MDAGTSIEINNDNEKYHPLILQNTVHKQISGIIEKIDPQKKHSFLEILHNSFRSVLSCFKCKSSLKENSYAFECGHLYCDQCSLNLNKCINCNSGGNVRTRIKNFSKILDIIKEIKSDFNTDGVIYEMIRYLLFPNKVAPKEEVVETVKFNTPSTVIKSNDSGSKKSRKRALNGKKPKTPASKGENSRKKLQFDRSESIDRSLNGLENDSENLFMETAQSRRRSTGKKMQSYLEQQPTIAEINHHSATKTKKRKNDDATDQSVDKVRRTKKKKSDSDTSSVEGDRIERSKGTKMKSEPCSLDLQNQGEAKEPNVTLQETKINSMLDAVKSTVGEMKREVKMENALASGRDVDTEELDLNVWKNNDKNEKKKSLFKSVKERNKKDVSISGTLNNLMDRNQLTPNQNTPTRSKLDLAKLRIKDLLGPSKDEAKIRKVTPRKTPQENKRMRKESSPDIVEIQMDEKKARKVSPRKTPLENKRMRKESSPDIVEMPKDEKENKKPSQETKTTGKESPPDIVDMPKNEKLNKTPSQQTKKARKESLADVNIPTSKTESQEVKKPPKQLPPDMVEIPKQLQKIHPPEETSSSTSEERTEAFTEPIDVPCEPVPEPMSPKDTKIPTNDSSIIAEKSPEIPPPTSSPQKTISVTKTGKPLTLSFAAKSRNTESKIALPLFPEINTDIFSQKSSICSSTPCGVKKTVKTYSRARNNLFNRSISQISPITEKEEISPNDSSLESYSVRVYSPEVPKDVESDPLTDNFMTRTPIKFSDLRPKVTETPVNLKTQIIVHAEVHEVPVTPPVVSAKSPLKVKPKLVINESPTNGIPIKSNPVDEIIAIDIDDDGDNAVDDVEKVIESVDKIAQEIFHQTSRNVEIEESQNPIPNPQDEREARAQKVKKLQQSINNKNEKSMSNLKKNFHVSPKLAVEKVKHCFIVEPPRSPSPSLLEQVNNYAIEPIQSNVTPKYSRAESPFYDETIATLKPCTPSRTVACQTSPDLHVALLKQEFPHLFEKYDPKSDFPLSVYDTPIDQTNDAASLATKTPNVSLLNASHKYTVVSSVSSSEKKFAEKHFANDSILCDSPFSTGSVNKTNVSGYAPLSPDKNPSTLRKLSCRLNFDDESSCDTVIERVPECVTMQDVQSTDPKKDETDCSKEIEFGDSVDDNMEEVCDRVEQEEMIASASILENENISNITVGQITNTEDVDKTFFDGDSIAVLFDHEDANGDEENKGDISIQVIPDTEDMAANGMDQDKQLTDDEDEIDFVAGTPTTQPRRLFTNTLEKIRTPCILQSKPPDVSLNEFSLSGNITPTISFIQPLPDVSQCTVTKNPSQAEVIPNGEIEHKDESDKISIELFNSGVSNSMSFESIHITTSGLKEADIKIIKKFCDKFSASYLDKLTDKSTHLIVKTDQKNRTARTFKYLQAIVSGVRIVTMKWIHECLSNDKIVSEEKCIPLDSSGECGPLRTYNMIKTITPSPLSWLRDYCVYFTEPVPRECTLVQLQNIMQKAGASVINSLKEFKQYSNHHRIIIVSEEDENDDAMNMRIAGWLQSYSAVSVEFNWILEVIGRNRLVSFADFEVVEIPNEYLLRLNFPPEMLQSEEEDQNSD